MTDADSPENPAGTPDSGSGAGAPRRKSRAEQWAAMSEEDRNDFKAYQRERQRRRIEGAAEPGDANFEERLNAALPPGFPEEGKNFYRSLNHFVLEQKSSGNDLSPDARAAITQIMEQNHATKEQAIPTLQLLNLTDDEIADIIQPLPDTPGEGEPEEVEPHEQGGMEGTGQGMDEQLEQMNSRADEMLGELPTGEELENLSPEDRSQVEELRAQIGKKKGKIAKLSMKVTDLFAEGEPGRELAGKGGKLLYFALLTAFVLLIMEMNLIYKMAASRRK